MNLIKQKHDYIQLVESNYLSNYERVDLNFNLVKVLHLWAQEKVIYHINTHLIKKLKSSVTHTFTIIKCNNLSNFP